MLESKIKENEQLRVNLTEMSAKLNESSVNIVTNFFLSGNKSL